MLIIAIGIMNTKFNFSNNFIDVVNVVIVVMLAIVSDINSIFILFI